MHHHAESERHAYIISNLIPTTIIHGQQTRISTTKRCGIDSPSDIGFVQGMSRAAKYENSSDGEGRRGEK